MELHDPTKEEHEPLNCKGYFGTGPKQAPTSWRKLWQESDTDVVMVNDLITVNGSFSTRDSGSRRFTCSVDAKGKVTHVYVSTGA